MYPFEVQRLIEQEADRLLPRLRGPPTQALTRNQRRFNRVVDVFGRNFDLCQAFKVQPARLGDCDLTRAMTDNALAYRAPPHFSLNVTAYRRNSAARFVRLCCSTLIQVARFNSIPSYFDLITLSTTTINNIITLIFYKHTSFNHQEKSLLT